MELSDIIRVVSAILSALVAICGVIGGVFWLVRRSARKLDKAEARARRFERERDDAIRQNSAAIAERDQAQVDLVAERAHRQRAAAIAIRNYNAWQGVNERLQTAAVRTRAAETRKKELEPLLAAQEARAADLENKLARADQQIEDQRQALERFEAQVELIANQDGRVWQTSPLNPPQFIPRFRRRNRRPTIISVFNLKGGVGKTTLTANLGGYLANCRERWVLLLDLDHQRSLTQLLFTTERRMVAATARRTIQDFLLSCHTGEDLQCAVEQVPGQGFERCWAVGNADASPGYGTQQNLDDLEMRMLGNWLINPNGVDIRFLLRQALHAEVIQERFDYVLIDCPPRLTTACINALAASDYLLVPAQAEPISARSVPHLLRRLRELRDVGVLPDLSVLGIVANMVSADAVSPTSSEVRVLDDMAAVATELWGEPVQVLESRIRRSDYYANCQRDSEHKLRLPSVVVGAIREQYGELADEIEERINENLGVAGIPA
jgi:cellulose biosynthesis protein BcsQ